MMIDEWLIDEEGFVPYAYPDKFGYLTIGYGTMIDKRKGGGITKEEGRYLMVNRLVPVVDGLDAAIPWWRAMNDVRQAVLVLMGYQMGLSGLLKFRRTLAAMESGDYERAAAGMMASKWAREDTPERASRAAQAMRTGQYTLTTKGYPDEEEA